ncbi:MAG: L,D-transpeptidase [Pseudomonadota bacterium]
MPATARITVDLSAQVLTLWHDQSALRQWPVSTAANGPGEISGSGCTPRGRHIIRAKIGAGAEIGAVFKARRIAGDVRCYSPEIGAQYPGRDWILTRILWLSGIEVGINRLGCVDTMRRYIYIHGTPHLDLLGRPASHGCIRMGNADIVELFDLVSTGIEVTLHE